MPILAVVLILISALLHASWNLAGKRSLPSSAFFLTASAASAVVLLPVLWGWRGVLLRFSPLLWGLIVATGWAQALYFSGLAQTYRSGDLSLAYPLVRALPVLMVPALSFALGRGSQISPIGLAGMLLVAAGCLLIPVRRGGLIQSFRAEWRTLAAAFVAALGTTGYLTIDDSALRLLGAAAGSGMKFFSLPLLYVELETLATLPPLALAVLLQPRERRAWGEVQRKALRTAILSGLVITAGYSLVLAAMSLAPNVSYITAFRQISIPIGAMLGIYLLKEPIYPLKIAGIGIVFCGLVLVALG